MESSRHVFTFLILSVMVLLTGKTATAETFDTPLDWPDLSSVRVEFEVNLMGFIAVSGEFRNVTATRDNIAQEPRRPSMSFSVNVASVDTQNAGRDAFLRSSAFFDVARFPTIRFTGKRLVRGGDGSMQLLGELTLRDTTRQVAFTLARATASRDPGQAEAAGITARTTIRRDEFGLAAFPMPVSNEVNVRVYVADVSRGIGAQQISRAD